MLVQRGVLKSRRHGGLNKGLMCRETPECGVTHEGEQESSCQRSNAAQHA